MKLIYLIHVNIVPRCVSVCAPCAFLGPQKLEEGVGSPGVTDGVGAALQEHHVFITTEPPLQALSTNLFSKGSRNSPWVMSRGCDYP